MASCSSHSGRGQDRVRGDAVLAQGYRAAQRLIAGAPPTDRPTGQEPMRRYTHPIPCPAVRTFPADVRAGALRSVRGLGYAAVGGLFLWHAYSSVYYLHYLLTSTNAF